MILGKKKYQYLIAYIHSNGFGKTSITAIRPIKTPETIKEIELSIEKNENLKTVGIINYKLLRKYRDKQ